MNDRLIVDTPEIETDAAVHVGSDDPTRGISHGDHATGRDTFVFDLMERGRPVAERRVLEMLREHEFVKADFSVTSKGTCRISSSLCQKILMH